MQRPLISQNGVTFSLSVSATVNVPTPLNSNMGETAMIDSFVISVPSTAGNSVFLGFNSGVTTATGLELLIGTATEFTIDHEGRQLYELQHLLQELRNGAMCNDGLPEAIPFVVWDISQIYLVAAATTTVSVAVFKAMYV